MSLISSNALPKKGRASWGNKRIVKRSDLKHPSFEGDPINFILTTSSQPERVQKIKERGNQLYLPIMH
jgi:hypothetical protein